ncbi:unannotated protein [freshwater metagenome]|uniref:Unannotated protein n=1 Tax=freshwater metagenome TaxID=449393 RepID=A0A6J5YBJ2_9ZZZZ
MCWVYWTLALMTSASPMSSRSWLHSSREKPSRALTGRGANAGSRSRRANSWNGGSEEMGGATPMGAGGASSVGRPSVMMIVRDVKCSVSLAIAETVAWVMGAHMPP